VTKHTRGNQNNVELYQDKGEEVSTFCKSYLYNVLQKNDIYYPQKIIENKHLLNNLEFDKLVRSFYNSLTNYAGTSADIDRSLCEVLLQILTDSLGTINKTQNDAFR
jgi:hypothetical protein